MCVCVCVCVSDTIRYHNKILKNLCYSNTKHSTRFIAPVTTKYSVIKLLQKSSFSASKLTKFNQKLKSTIKNIGTNIKVVKYYIKLEKLTKPSKNEYKMITSVFI